MYFENYIAPDMDTDSEVILIITKHVHEDELVVMEDNVLVMLLVN